MEENTKKKKKKRKIVSKVLLFIAVLLCAGGGYAYATVRWEVLQSAKLMQQDKSGTLKKVDAGAQYDSDIINVLLIGVDGRDENEDEAGNSDSCMIATMDLKHNQLKLTSIMRDTLVDVPGYESSSKASMHKFNALYAVGNSKNGVKGGVETVYEFIYKKFKLHMDGYAVVNFLAFEEAVNAMGGVELNLTKSEAENLNGTNYAKRRYRTFKVGKQTLNGNQTLAYCRIRHGKLKYGHMPYVYSLSGLVDDYARTERQRLAMQAVFTKFKSMSMTKWKGVADKMVSFIQSDIDGEVIFSYIQSVLGMGTTKIEQLRFPAGKVAGTYKETLGYSDREIKELRDFINKEVK